MITIRFLQCPRYPHHWFNTLGLTIALMAGLVATPASRAQSTLSDASAASAVPVALSVVSTVAMPSMILAGGATFFVSAVEVSADGSVWVLERASDGARASMRFAGQVLTASGTAVLVTAVATGWVLSSAGTAIAFIPNQIGRSLLHHERITR